MQTAIMTSQSNTVELWTEHAILMLAFAFRFYARHHVAGVRNFKSDDLMAGIAMVSLMRGVVWRWDRWDVDVMD